MFLMQSVLKKPTIFFQSYSGLNQSGIVVTGLSAGRMIGKGKYEGKI